MNTTWCIAAGQEDLLFEMLTPKERSLRRVELYASRAAAFNDGLPEDSDLEISGNELRLIRVKGLLTHESDWFSSLCGETGYDQIKQAVASAAADPGVKRIALLISSPGGQVSGLAPLCDYLCAVNDKQKPIYAFLDEYAHSAAYRLAACCKSITATRSASTASIGVMQLHSYQKTMAEEINVVTLLREGQKKALGGSWEPLSEEARAEMQAEILEKAEEFYAFVAARRNIEVQAVRDLQGVALSAEKAQTLGLVDNLSSLDSFLQQMMMEIAMEKLLSLLGAADENTAMERVQTLQQQQQTLSQLSASMGGLKSLPEMEAHLKGLSQAKMALEEQRATDQATIRGLQSKLEQFEQEKNRAQFEQLMQANAHKLNPDLRGYCEESFQQHGLGPVVAFLKAAPTLVPLENFQPPAEKVGALPSAGGSGKKMAVSDLPAEAKEAAKQLGLTLEAYVEMLNNN